MSLAIIKSELRNFLSRSYRIQNIDDNCNIFEVGIVNSLFFMQLLIFIEKKFKLELEQGEFDISKLTSINSIADLIDGKLKGSDNE